MSASSVPRGPGLSEIAQAASGRAMTITILSGIAMALAIAAMIVTTVALLRGRAHRSRQGGAP